MQAADLAERLKNILEGLTWDIFSYVCLGLFEQHKLMFAFQITCKIMQQEGLLDAAEIDFFIKGKLSLDAAPQAKPAAWISDQVSTALSSSMLVLLAVNDAVAPRPCVPLCDTASCLQSNLSLARADLHLQWD